MHACGHSNQISASVSIRVFFLLISAIYYVATYVSAIAVSLALNGLACKKEWERGEDIRLTKNGVGGIDTDI